MTENIFQKLKYIIYGNFKTKIYNNSIDDWFKSSVKETQSF